MSEFEPSLACFCVFFVFFFALFFWVGERVHGCLSIVLFTAAVGLQMSGFEPSLPSVSVFFRFVLRSFFLGG